MDPTTNEEIHGTRIMLKVYLDLGTNANAIQNKNLAKRTVQALLNKHLPNNAPVVELSPYVNKYSRL